jgi:hypothetical protein
MLPEAFPQVVDHIVTWLDPRRNRLETELLTSWLLNRSSEGCCRHDGHD